MRKSISISLLTINYWIAGCGDNFTSNFDGKNPPLLNGIHSHLNVQDVTENYTKWSKNNEKLQQRIYSPDGIAELTFELMSDEVQPNFDVWLGELKEREYEIRVTGDYKVNHPKLKLKAEFLVGDIKSNFPELKNLELQLLLTKMKYFFIKADQENPTYKFAQLIGEGDQLFVVIDADQAGRYGWMIDKVEDVDSDFDDDDDEEGEEEEEENKNNVDEWSSASKDSSSAPEPFSVTFNHSDRPLGSAKYQFSSRAQGSHTTAPADDARLNVPLTGASRANPMMNFGTTLSTEAIAADVEEILHQQEKGMASTLAHDGPDSIGSLTGDEAAVLLPEEAAQQQKKEKAKKKKLWKR